jgi:serine/threonine protein kinase/tetratricopeptide (TPR) repeat protein
MTPDTIFAQAIEIQSDQQRAEFLDASCGVDAELRREVEGLVRDYFRAGDFLERPAASLAAIVDEPACERPGTVIGPYKLMEQIGEGGFGLVFVAEQQRPVHRRVALKVIKPGMDSRQIVARFEAERQALALMDHPNIARVFDAGATPSGRPYFVMELVKGVPINTFCDADRLTTRERLRLFVSVCSAVQHAHQKGVIHRDLKPSNVLVMSHDGTPVAKVIDFGVAKAIGQQLTEKTVYTQFTQMVGTPLYMSPEQAGQSGLDVDTRTDIYALGVLLYELLTGTTPFDEERLRTVGFDEMRRIIRDEEPAKPSARISTLGPAAVTVSVNRQTDPKRLSRLCRGELDWIVMKAMEKDRNRRYESASAFAADVERYLRDEPVQACPPSLGYRLRKFVRRHKGPVVAASLVILALLGGIVGTTAGLIHARAATEQEHRARVREAEQRQLAEEHQRLAEANEKTAVDEKQTVEAVRTFLLADLLMQADPFVQADAVQRLGGGFESKENPTIKELLDRAAAGLTPAKVNERFPDRPAVQASILRTVGDAYRGVGDYEKAAEFLVRASDICRDTRGADHADTLTCLHSLGHAYRAAGKLPQAIDLFLQVRDGRSKQLGADHPETLTALFSLAMAYRAADRATEAIALYEQVRDARMRQLGPDHPRTLSAVNSLAVAYRTAGRTSEAIALYEQVRDARVKHLGADHPDTHTTLSNLAVAYRAVGRTAEAIPLHETVLSARVKKFGTDHPFTLTALQSLAQSYLAAGERERALSALEQIAVAIEKRQFKHQYADEIVGNVVECHEQIRQYEQAEAWRRKWLAVVKEKHGPESAGYAKHLEGLGSNLLRQNKHADAESIFRESLSIICKTQPEAWTAFNAQSLLGEALTGQKKYADAEPFLLDAYQGLERAVKIPPKFKVRLTEALQRLVQLYEAWEKPDEAAKWRRELKTHGRAAEGTAQPNDK